MEPEIIESGQMTIVGMTFYGDPFKDVKDWSSENEIGKIWARFSKVWDARKAEIANVLDHDAGYEVHYEPEEYKETKNFYVTVGVEVSEVGVVPLELSFKVLPATTYAVFKLKGKEIASNWPDRIYKEWMPGSGYEEAHKFLIECYGPTFKGPDDPESELVIRVPVRRKAG